MAATAGFGVVVFAGFGATVGFGATAGVVFGSPIRFPAVTTRRPTREQLDAFADHMMQTISDLMR